MSGLQTESWVVAAFDRLSVVEHLAVKLTWLAAVAGKQRDQRFGDPVETPQG